MEKASKASGVCFWQIVDNPLTCEATGGVGTWHSCQKYLRNVEGEGEVSADVQKSLRWRISGLDEKPRAKKGEEDVPLPLTFGGVQVEVVNGVSLSR